MAPPKFGSANFQPACEDFKTLNSLEVTFEWLGASTKGVSEFLGSKRPLNAGFLHPRCKGCKCPEDSNFIYILHIGNAGSIRCNKRKTAPRWGRTEKKDE